MPKENLSFLLHRLEQGDETIGQVRISGRYVLSHCDDAEDDAKEVFSDPYDAIDIARYDDEGNFRPLKSAPNLRHGWRLELRDADQVLQALDFLYPAAIGTAREFKEDKLHVFPLRNTLKRQSGMYAVVKSISHEQACHLIEDTCTSPNGCLKKILWNIEEEDFSHLSPRSSSPSASVESIPLLCPEACNLLIAAGRKVVKAQDKHSAH